mgnify:CR=1 FL=1
MLRRSLAVLALGLLVTAAACGSDDGPAPPPPRPAPPTRATPEQEAEATRLLTGPAWYRSAVFYEVNVRSFQDSNGDGVGDLAGLTSRLDYLKALGVDALWLMPIMPTPFEDSGYDVADYRAISPEYGDMAAFEALLREAHARGMRVVIDLVLNHTSSKHAWFEESRASRTNAKADWYVWSDTPSRADIGCGTHGAQFGSSAWELEPARGQYYYHRFYKGQPDLNYRNPEVVKETLDVARFWLDKGVDGFRCDVVGLLYESAQGCEMIAETREYIRQLRRVVDSYPDRVMVAEPVELENATPYFGAGADMFHMAFDFAYGYFWGLSFSLRDRKGIERAMATAASFPEGAQDAPVIGSHDVVRAWSAAGGKEWKHRRAAELQLTMRGTPFLYYGEELGLRPGTETVVDLRDAARTPMPWTRAPGHGFSTGKPWLAFAPEAEITNVEAEDADSESMLTFYRALLAFRRGHAVWGTGATRPVALDNPRLVAFTREDAREAYLVVVSLSEDDEEASAAESLAGEPRVVWGDATVSLSPLRVRVPGAGSVIVKLR